VQKNGTIKVNATCYTVTLRASRLPDTLATRHFGTKTLRTRMKHFSTVSRHFCTKKHGTRHFGIRSTKSLDTLDPAQFRQDTAPPVIRLKVGAEVSWCRYVLWPKCPAPSVTLQLKCQSPNCSRICSTIKSSSLRDHPDCSMPPSHADHALSNHQALFKSRPKRPKSGYPGHRYRRR